MSTKLQNIFQASLESDEVVPGEVENLDEIIEVEDDMIAVEEAAQEVEDGEEIIAGLDEVAEGLESIYTHMEASLENGGLTPGEAAALNLAVEAHTRRLGLENNLFASMESFGAASDRIGATQVSMESIKAKLEKIWQAIKNAVARALRAIGDFFAKLFKGMDRLEERVKTLEKEVKEAAKKKADDKTFAVPGATALHVAGKTDVKSIIGGLKDTAAAIDATLKAVGNASKDYYEQTTKLVTDSSFLENDNVEKLESALKKIGTDLVAVATKSVQRGKDLSGGVRLESSSSADAEGGARIRSPLALVRGSQGADTSREIKPLTVGEMQDVLSSVKAMIKAIKQEEKAIEAVKKQREKAVESGKKLIEAADKGKLGKAWDSARLNMALRATGNDVGKVVPQLASHGFSVARAALGLVAKSLAAYK